MLWASSKIASESEFVSVSTLKLSSIPTDDPDITSPSTCDKSCIEAFASGMTPFTNGANPLIIDIHGLNVTTTSPNSETVDSLSLTCSIDNFAPLTIFFIFLTLANSPAYACA